MDGGFVPPTSPFEGDWCPEDPKLCLAEPSFAMWAWMEQYPDGYWFLVDEDMVVRAIAKNVGGAVDFTTLEAVLFTLLDAP